MRQHKRTIAGAAARVTILAALSVTLTPLLGTSLSPGERPKLVEEARAALFNDAVVTEARALWENRPASQMADRGGRVTADKPRTFAAGRLGERGSLIRDGLVGGDELMRTALAGPQNFSERMSTAASLSSRAPQLGVANAVRTAALRPTSRPADRIHDGAGSEMAYAPSFGPSVSSRFDDILRDRDSRFVPPIGEKDHGWAATPLAPSVFSKEEQKCLATAVYFEARGEVARGQEAVAQVVLNRVRAPAFPDTICDVVYQNRHMRNRCQFSFACDGTANRITDRGSYAKAERVALAVTKGEIWLSEVGSATHYHATYVRPRWARAMNRVEKIGLHIFYRTINGGWH